MEKYIEKLLNKEQLLNITSETFLISIQEKLKIDYKKYELYILLGKYYEQKNINQAWLCYENAEFYCDNQVGLEIIRSKKQQLEKCPEWDVKPSAIVILSYNLLEMTRQCLENIKKYNPSSAYEIIVVDNASEHNVVKWLTEQNDIKLILNDENKGFPMGCNQGIKIADPDADVFLLNNDAFLLPNSLFWLRMGLYESPKVGAVGSVSNHAVNYQSITEKYDSLEEYEVYAINNNVPMLSPYEEKNWLQGFALLLRRQALDVVGLLDTRFSPGNYEDNDIGYRMKKAGFNVRLCYNSFIYHYGNGGGANTKTWSPVLIRNYHIFKEKWGFSEENFNQKRKDIVSLITHEKNEQIKVLEIGCGLGETLAYIKHLWPNAQVYGIELNETIAEMTSLTYDVLHGNIEHMNLNYENEMFDYIIFGDIFEQMYDPQKVMKKMLPYLKEDGRYLCSIFNMMNIKVIENLINGKFSYESNGILSKSNIRFFTLDSFIEMAVGCDMETDSVINIFVNISEDSEKLAHYLSNYQGTTVDTARFMVYKYLIQLKKK